MLTIAIVAFGIYTYNVLKVVFAKEEITGNQSEIPTQINELPPITEGEEDWPNWRGPNFDGKSSLINIKKDWSNGLTKLWEVDFLCQGQSTATWSAPVVKGNRLIISGRNETSDLVFCLNADDGNLIWKGEYLSEASTSHGPGARATAFIDSNMVYTFGRSGDLVCWSLFDGKKLWHKNVKNEGGEEPEWGLSSTPLVIDNKVIVQGGGTALVLAYDKLNGDLIWKTLQGAAGYSASIPLIVDSMKSMLVYHGTSLSCLNPENGSEIWKVPWETDYGVNATTPVIDKKIIFHTSGYGKGGQALEVTKDNFKVLWTNTAIASHHSDPFIIDGYLYGYSGQSIRNSGEFKCVELKTGKEIWTTDEIGYGTATYTDGHILCLDLKGNLFLIRPAPEKFVKVAEFKNAIPEVKSLAWTAPVVAMVSFI
ncbi:MAG: PQQ-binding-like beta-propeller repeat protein [Cyclobacteriaceae bacterium]|nr:PQQ-binding-like beta-propeller repeat protein [Cyclobacteriaceae bacterium]